MAYEINWHMTNHQLEKHPLYQKYSAATLDQIKTGVTGLKTDMKAVLMNKDNALIMAYLSWLLRCVELVS